MLILKIIIILERYNNINKLILKRIFVNFQNINL